MGGIRKERLRRGMKIRGNYIAEGILKGGRTETVQG
jgi:hypothetical protein